MSSRNRPKAARSLGIRPAKLETEPNNSLDLSICDWHGGPVSDVKLNREARAAAVTLARRAVRKLRRQA